MKISSLFFLASLALSFSVRGMTPTFSGGLLQWEHDGKWGFLNTKGEVAVPFMWDKVGWGFENGFAKVSKGGKSGLINTNGHVVVPLEWGDIYFPQGGGGVPPFPVKRDGNWGFVDESGKVLVEPAWDKVRGFKEDMAAIKKHERWGFVDLSGRVIVPPERWTTVYDFKEGSAWVIESKDGETNQGRIDLQGKFTSEKMDAPELGEEAKVKVEQLGLDLKGPYDRELGHWLVMKDGKRGLVDGDANIITPAKWDGIGSKSEGLGPVISRDGEGRWKVGFMDEKGLLVIPPEWDQPKRGHPHFSAGVTGVRRGDKEGLIDRTGKPVGEFEWDEIVTGTADGDWVVVRGGKQGMIDKLGNVIVQPEWDWCHPWGFKDGLLRVRQDEEVGFVNREGELVIPLGGPEFGDFLIHEREWTDQGGRKVKAPVLRVEVDKAILVVNEKEMPFPLEKLSAKDRELLEIASQ